MTLIGKTSILDLVNDAFRPVFGRRTGSVLLVLLTAGFVLLPLFAGTTGRVSGVVRDRAGAAIAGVQVTATNSSMGIKSKATTDKKGSYTFPNLATGPYEIRVEANGYKTQTRTVFVHVDGAFQIDLMLDPAEKLQPEP